MLIRIQNEQRVWRVLHPQKTDSAAFREGSAAFDFADALARELHLQTGQACAVRVEVSEAFVDAVRYG